MDKNLPSKLKNRLGNKPIEISWKRNKVRAKLKQFLPRGMNDYRILFCARHLLANIGQEFLKNPPGQYKARDFKFRTNCEKQLYSAFASSMSSWEGNYDLKASKLVEYIRDNLMIDLDNEIVADPCFNSDGSLNEELTFWKLVDEVNTYLKFMNCSEKVKTQVQSMLMKDYLLPKDIRDDLARYDNEWPR